MAKNKTSNASNANNANNANNIKIKIPSSNAAVLDLCHFFRLYHSGYLCQYGNQVHLS